MSQGDKSSEEKATEVNAAQKMKNDMSSDFEGGFRPGQQTKQYDFLPIVTLVTRYALCCKLMENYNEKLETAILSISQLATTSYMRWTLNN